MISIIITSFKEPKTIGKAIESFLQQDIEEDYELIAAAPDKDTLDIIKGYSKKYKQVRLFKDPGKGKTFALNLILPKTKGEIIILTDGDVYVSRGSVHQILNEFRDKKVGCVTGKPVSSNPRDNLFGYWSHLLCNAAHTMRLKRDNCNNFLECSGYLWAFRNHVIKEIPRETAEDTIVPILFFLKGYQIRYSPNAEVYVKYPTNLHEFIDQKKRTAKGHETLGRYIDVRKIPRMKSLKNEMLGGFSLFLYPRSLKEIYWTFLLFPVRLYTWLLAFFHLHIKQDAKVDGWQAVNTTKE
jgi:cellulose synthase/poly-beta-1,6-N-acetylglucosamine synthase-like glycosyltransferase